MRYIVLSFIVPFYIVKFEKENNSILSISNVCLGDRSINIPAEGREWWNIKCAYVARREYQQNL